MSKQRKDALVMEIKYTEAVVVLSAVLYAFLKIK